MKHAILDGYLPSYFNAIKRWHNNLVFIDGFAGPGSYSSGSDTFDGSPIRALRVVSSREDLSKQVLCVFVEKNETYCKRLDERVKRFEGDHDIAKSPIVVNALFSETIDELLKSVDPTKGLAPTFLFVDPCGVDGVTMTHIADILSRDFCEVFIFFNYDGINRITGLAQRRDGASDTLTALYGSEETVAALVSAISKARSPEEREQIIVKHYKDALARISRAKFLLPLRIEKEDRRSTSHYLVHATKHPLGFRIMKEVMWKASGKIECEGDTLALLQASRKKGGSLFTHPELGKLRKSILRELEGGPKPVNQFLDSWVDRPTDMFAESVYRREILQLEATGRVAIYAEDGTTPMPASARPKRKGPTLARARNLVARLVT